MFDTTVPNAEIHELITSGLKHNDQVIIDCTIGALATFVSGSRESRTKGLTYHIDRGLQKKSQWYEVLVEIWDANWKRVGEKLPVVGYSDNFEVVLNKTACLVGQPTWALLPDVMAYLYPQDSNVYEIILSAYPIPEGGFRGGQIEDDNNPLPLLNALFDGQFNNLKDQQLRIELLSNRKIARAIARLAARSLGDFRSDAGLNTLIKVLEEDRHEYGTPKLEIIDAILKYDVQLSGHLPTLQDSLESVVAKGKFERDLLTTLSGKLTKLKETFAENTRENEE